MKLTFIRFMLFCSRIELALAILGNNRRLAAQSREDEIRWEGELLREEALRRLEEAL